MSLEIGAARVSDAPNVRFLLSHLGYELPIEMVAERLEELSGRSAGPVLLASESGKIVGLLALHWCFMLHLSKPEARITALVVREDARGKGVGRALVEHAVDLAREAGCGAIELTTALHRTEAQAFYKALGFAYASMRFVRPINEQST